MIAAYIIAGSAIGFYSMDVLGCMTPRSFTVNAAVNFLFAFVGGVAGHLLFNLVYN